jgi:hypothetical protein
MGKIQRQPALKSRAASLPIPESHRDPEAEPQRINSKKPKGTAPQCSGNGLEPAHEHLEEHRYVHDDYYQFFSASESDRKPVIMCHKFDADSTLRRVTSLLNSGCSVHMACKEVIL